MCSSVGETTMQPITVVDVALTQQLLSKDVKHLLYWSVHDHIQAPG